MSNEIKGISIRIGGDTSDLQKALSGVNSKTKEVQKELREVNRQLKYDPTNTTLIAQKHELLGKQISNTREKLETLKTAQEQFDKESLKTEEGQAQYRALQREIIKTEDQLKSLQAEFSKTNAASAQLDKISSSLDNAAKKTADVGTALTKNVTTPIAAVGAASVAAWTQIDEGMDIVVQKTGATGAELESLQDSVKNLAKSIPTSYQTAGTAISEISTKFGLTGEALEDLSTRFIQFADINDQDVSASIDNLQKISAAYNMTTEETALLLDQMNSVGQDTGISMDTLQSSMVSNAVTMKQMGLNAYSSAAFLGQLELSSIDSGTALSGLKKALAHATAEGKPMTQALQEIQDAMTHAGSAQEGLQAAIDLFGSKAGPAIYDACMNGSLSFETLASDAEIAGGSVEETYEGMQDATDRLQVVWNQLMDLGYELAEAMMPLIDAAIETLTPLLESVSEWLQSLSSDQLEMIVTIGLVVAAIGPVMTAISGVLSIGSTLASGMSWLCANPVVLVIGAIVGLVGYIVYLWNTSESFRQGVTTILQGIRNGVMSAWQFVSGIIQTVWTTIQNVWNFISGIFHTAVSVISGCIGTIVTTIGRIGTAITTAKNTVKSMIDAIKNCFNFKFSWPHIPLPHFSITGSINPLSWLSEGVPRISVQWYKQAMEEAMLLSSPTIFGSQDGHLLGAGEAGSEFVVGQSKLAQTIASVTGSDRVPEIISRIEQVLTVLEQYLPEVGHQQVILDTGVLVGETAAAYDMALGDTFKRTERGG